MIDLTPQTVTVASEDGIGTITLANVERRNALSLATMRELLAIFERFASDRTVKVLILRALGPVFSAGHDLREMQCAGDEADVDDVKKKAEKK